MRPMRITPEAYEELVTKGETVVIRWPNHTPPDAVGDERLCYYEFPTEVKTGTPARVVERSRVRFPWQSRDRVIIKLRVVK